MLLRQIVTKSHGDASRYLLRQDRGRTSVEMTGVMGHNGHGRYNVRLAVFYLVLHRIRSVTRTTPTYVRQTIQRYDGRCNVRRSNTRVTPA